MPIFDEIGKKISQTTQSALKSTKDMADMSRINTLLAEEQKLLSSFYMQIGKKYFELNPSPEDEDFASLCASAAESFAKVTALEQNIQEIKGIRRCPRCEAGIPVSTPFCGTCGYDTRGDPDFASPNLPRKCPACNTEVADNMAFCTACGQKI